MQKSFIYKPIYFFLNSLFISAIFWLCATYVSFQQSMDYLLFPLILGGMAGPSIAAFVVMAQSKNVALWSDFYERLYFYKIKIHFILISLLLMPCLIVSAIGISLLFGQPLHQFMFLPQAPDQALQGVNFLGLLIVLFISCSLEEIGWRGYGIDSLNNKFNLWQTSLIFATIWSLWHIPAFFIHNGYFQKEILNAGFMHVFIYFMSLFPLTMLINWLYIKNNRSILIAIFFHMILNLSYGLFHLELLTKAILMILLFLVAGIIVFKENQLFFNHEISGQK